MQCAEGSLIITYPYHGGVLFATFSLEKSYGCMLVSSNIIRVQCTLGWIHFWQIHVGPSASVHSEMNTLWAGAARFARDLGPSALRAFGLSQVGFGLILRLYTKYSLPLYTQGDCSFQFYEVPEVYIVNLPQRVLRDLSKDWCTLLIYQKLMYME